MLFKINTLIDKVEKLKLAKKKIVFTNGCFDILHKGHFDYLRQSKSLGDFLIVGLNSDDSVKLLKGIYRPINNQNLRANNLTKLDYIDAVIIFTEQTPKKLIKLLLPDILTKGGDYKINQIVGSDTVTKNGGKVKILPHIKGYSTTDIINNQGKGLTGE
ncbi:MAG: D-glycero-beta-D-manno-heptose 1-phosphate adenylyltransferase [Candidatus Marinimicrobia bacterium]|nr:D-glycero-beta-D-manno-heptose 1-phosphate adenylyltransferase [Candidatus Neomarinimicrobiota bacterium]|tara:strand:+ start:4777 stop:5253 length:477 start_codon:yes stop_codon:yes gene_type:complete